MQNRRHFLQSSTALIALPFLESLGFRRFAAAATPAVPPKRLLFLSFGWGVTESTWYPDITRTGKDYELPPGLKPLARHKADFSVVQGLWNKNTRDGHQGSTFWLTGADRYAQPGQSFFNSISADQVAAAQLGLETRYASLQFNGTSMNAALTGHGPGLSLAWNLSGKPVAGFNGPMVAYHALFSKNTTPIEEQKALLEQKRSVLDAVLDNAHALQRGLSKNDNAKLEEYFQGVREIELRLSKEEQWIGVEQPKAPFGEPKPDFNGKEEVLLIYDLMVAAMQTDSTRVLTFRQPVDTLLKAWDIKVHPHDISHYHTTLGEKLIASQKRDEGLSELLALFLDKLKAVKEADGSRLFDHCALAYGSNLRTGHELSNCPTILSGGGAGLKLGEHIVAPKNTPLCNAWLSMLHGVGVKAERHGDSTGPLKEILA